MRENVRAALSSTQGALLQRPSPPTLEIAEHVPEPCPGTRAETARRRMVVEDLWKAGLSVRAISAGTGIPVGSVHKAMRAITRAEAKKQVATAEIANALLGKTLSHRGGGRT
jgi:hypothetical protein